MTVLSRRGRAAQLKYRRELLRWEGRPLFRQPRAFAPQNSVAFVQTAALGSTSSGLSVATGAFASNPTVGNYLVGWAWGWSSNTASGSTFTFSDTGTNSWVVPANCKQFIANDLWLACGYAKVASTAGTFKVTMTTGTIIAGAVMCVAAEFSGVAATSPQDGTAAGTAPGTTANTGMAPGSMTVQSGSLVAGVWASDDAAATSHVNGVAQTGNTTPSPGTGPTGITAVGTMYANSFEIGQAGYAIGPASPSNPAWSTSPDTAAKWGAAQFALLASAAAFTWQPLTGPEIPRRGSPWAVDYQFARPGSRAPGQFGPGRRPRRSWRPQGRLLVPEWR